MDSKNGEKREEVNVGIFPTDQCTVCFDVKYFQKNIFQFYRVCFAIKYLIKSKIFSINQINISKFM